MTGCSTSCTLFEITELLAFARGCYEKKVKRYLTWNGYSNSQVRASGRILFLYRTLMRNYKPLRLTTVKQGFTAFREWRLYMVIWASGKRTDIVRVSKRPSRLPVPGVKIVGIAQRKVNRKKQRGFLRSSFRTTLQYLNSWNRLPARLLVTQSKDFALQVSVLNSIN